MNIFETIMGKIFQGNKPAAAKAAPKPASAPAAASASSAPKAATMPAAQSASPAPAANQNVDVNQILTQIAQKKGEKLNWQTSIVDLMKLLDMDSSLQARKQLAQELQYKGDMNDSASMNIWLQKEVMKRFAANGGRVPNELLH